MGRKKKPKLPEIGAAFAIKVEDGRYTVCRVLREPGGEALKSFGKSVVLVAASAWIGHEIPSADDPTLRVLYQIHHWVDEEPPADFIPIGKIEPTEEELATECQAFGGWEYFRYPALRQWRWDHDREAVLAEDLAAKEKEAERRLAAVRDYETTLHEMTLEKLVKRKRFEAWKGFTPPKALKGSREVMKRTIEQLIKVGPDSSEQVRMAILQECIEAFNELDTQLSFIATIEREDICEEFELIVHACGMGHHQDLADKWREW